MVARQCDCLQVPRTRAGYSSDPALRVPTHVLVNLRPPCSCKGIAHRARCQTCTRATQQIKSCEQRGTPPTSHGALRDQGSSGCST
eukprot:3742622-Amphidinium_carterae.1